MSEHNAYLLTALTILAPYADDPRVARCVTEDHIDWGCILAPSATWTVGQRAVIEAAANILDGSTYQRADIGSLIANADDEDWVTFLAAIRNLRLALHPPARAALDLLPVAPHGGPSRAEILAGIRLPHHDTEAGETDA